MDTKKQNIKEPTEATASKMAAGRKLSGDEASTSSNQGASANKAPSANQGASKNPGTSPNQGSSANQHTAGSQGTSLNQGANGPKPADQDLLQHAKQATGEIMDQVQQGAGKQLNRQKESAATDLSNVANAVRRLGDNLGEESGPIARYAAEYGGKAANSLERLSTYIREQDPKQLLSDVQDFGRRQPALLLGGAFLLGFAGARLIKSSMDAGSQRGFNPGIPARTNGPSARPSLTPNAR